MHCGSSNCFLTGCHGNNSCATFQTLPFFGVEPAILSEHGEELEGEAEGYLVSSRNIHIKT